MFAKKKTKSSHSRTNHNVICIETLCGHTTWVDPYHEKLTTVGELQRWISTEFQWSIESFRLIQNGQDVDSDACLFTLLYYEECLANQTLRFWAILRTTPVTVLHSIRFTIKVILLEGKSPPNFQLTNIQPHALVAQVKEMLVSRVGIPRAEQKLVLHGTTLSDHQLIGESIFGHGVKSKSPAPSSLSQHHVKLLVMQKVVEHAEIFFQIHLAGGGSYCTTMESKYGVRNLKTLLVKSRSFDVFGTNFQLYDADTRLPLDPERSISFYRFPRRKTLLAAPIISTLLSLTNKARPSSLVKNIQERHLPCALDVFFKNVDLNSSEKNYNSPGPSTGSSSSDSNTRSSIGSVASSGSTSGLGAASGSTSGSSTSESSNTQSARFSYHLSHHPHHGDHSFSQMSNSNNIQENVTTRLGFRGLSRGFLSSVGVRRKQLPVEYKDKKLQIDTLKSVTVKKCEDNQKGEEHSVKEEEPAAAVDSKRSKKNIGCHTCGRRLPIHSVIAGKCRCGHIFCAAHISGTAHQCTFNFKCVEKDRLEQALPTILPSKVNQI